MTEVLLCLVSFSLVGWMILLKSEITKLKEENRKLRNALKMGIREMTGDIEVTKPQVQRLHKTK